MKDWNFLNWDHEINQTPLVDILENIRLHVSKFTGWEKLCVTFKDRILDIEVLDGHWPKKILKVDFKEPYVPKELYGRTNDTGLCEFHLIDILKPYPTNR